MNNLITHSFKQQKGIHDLMGTHAWVGGSQGDESTSNKVSDNHEWMIFTFDGIDSGDQKAIDHEVLRRIMHNKLYVEELKKSGEYGKEYEMKISMVPCPLFDEVQNTPPAESYRMVILDLSKEP